MTYPLTTNGHKLLLVEVPEDAYEFEVSQHPETDTELIYQMPVNVKEQGKDFGGSVIYLEKYNHHASYSILGTITNGQIDFDCDRFVKEIHPEGVWEDYLQQEEGFYDAKKSFLSLLSANGITGAKIICLEIKK